MFSSRPFRAPVPTYLRMIVLSSHITIRVQYLLIDQPLASVPSGLVQRVMTRSIDFDVIIIAAVVA